MKTIAVTERTKMELESLKKALGIKSYDKLLSFLVRNVKAKRIKEAWKYLSLTKAEAAKIEKILEEKRKKWWKGSY